MLVIFSIKVLKPSVTQSSNCKMFYNTATVLSYSYDGTIAFWINILLFVLSLSHLVFFFSLCLHPHSLSHIPLSSSFKHATGAGLEVGVGVAWRVEVPRGLVRPA